MHTYMNSWEDCIAMSSTDPLRGESGIILLSCGMAQVKMLHFMNKSFKPLSQSWKQTIV